MKKLLIILTILTIALPAGTIKPHVMGARDHPPRHYDHSVGSGRHHDTLFSTFEATAEISSVISIGASSEATTYGDHPPHYRHALNFIDENRIEITQDMAKAEGEHLKTLLTMIDLKSDTQSLLAIQSDFDTLSQLSADELLTRLKAMQS
ncbi:MAG: hypothetical protein IE889_00735 [Campylobacterales bacterium]|nr:hypothetical protein [Campylobacterales bacterium]